MSVHAHVQELSHSWI